MGGMVLETSLKEIVKAVESSTKHEKVSDSSAATKPKVYTIGPKK